MKILWVKSDFLHPTTRGGQIRTLETIKRLHQKHLVHYIAFDDPVQREGPRRAGEYSSAHYAIPHSVAEKKLTSPAFVTQLIAGMISPLPIAIVRWRSVAMRREIERLQRSEQFDAIVCDFLSSAPNIPDLSQAVIFQHNVEAMIWCRHVEHTGNVVKKAYFQLQAKRMAQYEGEACRKAKRVIAVSEADAATMRREYGVRNVSPVTTGVDLEYFRRPAQVVSDLKSTSDLVFVGSMDWMPNSEGIRWFVREVFPLILKKRPQTTFAVVGRKPPPDVDAMTNERIKVTGTEAQAHLLAGWLRSRLQKPIGLEHEPSDKLVGVELDGKPAPFPPGDPPLPADLLSDELDKLSRDPVYEAAVLAAVT